MVQHSIEAEKLVRPVVVEVRFDNLLAIQRIVLVELDDPLDQRGLVSKIEVIEKTLRIEFAVDQGIAPINRQAPRRHGLDDLLRRVPRQGGVFEGDVELVRLQELDLAQWSPRHPIPDVVERAAAGIHLLVAAETVKEIVPLAGGSRVPRVAGNEGAEVSLGGQDLVDIIAVSEQDVRLVIKGVERPAQVTRIVQVMAGERVVTRREVRAVGFAREENAGAGMQAVMVPEARIDHEIRPVVKLHGISGFQEVVNPIVVLLEPGPEIAEIDADGLHGLSGRAKTESQVASAGFAFIALSATWW